MCRSISATGQGALHGFHGHPCERAVGVVDQRPSSADDRFSLLLLLFRRRRRPTRPALAAGMMMRGRPNSSIACVRLPAQCAARSTGASVVALLTTCSAGA